MLHSSQENSLSTLGLQSQANLGVSVQVQCKMLDAWGWCAGKAQGDGMGRLGGRRVQDGEHVIFF